MQNIFFKAVHVGLLCNNPRSLSAMLRFEFLPRFYFEIQHAFLKSRNFFVLFFFSSLSWRCALFSCACMLCSSSVVVGVGLDPTGQKLKACPRWSVYSCVAFVVHLSYNFCFLVSAVEANMHACSRSDVVYTPSLRAYTRCSRTIP